MGVLDQHARVPYFGGWASKSPYSPRFGGAFFLRRDSRPISLQTDEPWQNLIGLLGYLSREVLDGQFFALIASPALKARPGTWSKGSNGPDKPRRRMKILDR